MGKVKNIVVIGLGEVGETVITQGRELVKEYNLDYNFCGVEVDADKIHKFRSMGFDVTDKIDKKYDGYLISVWSMAQIRNVLDQISKLYPKLSDCKEDFFISIESTIDPSELNSLLEYCDGNGLLDHLVICPHRLVYQKPEYGAFNLIRVLGMYELSYAYINIWTQLAFEFYNEMYIASTGGMANRGEGLFVTNYKIAVLSKIIENALRFVDIVIAQELKILCDNNNIEFNDLRAAINTKFNMNLKQARDGVDANGTGHCLSRDVKLASKYLTSDLMFAAADLLNEVYKKKYGTKSQ